MVDGRGIAGALLGVSGVLILASIAVGEGTKSWARNTIPVSQDDAPDLPLLHIGLITYKLKRYAGPQQEVEESGLITDSSQFTGSAYAPGAVYGGLGPTAFAFMLIALVGTICALLGICQSSGKTLLSILSFGSFGLVSLALIFYGAGLATFNGAAGCGQTACPPPGPMLPSFAFYIALPTVLLLLLAALLTVCSSDRKNAPYAFRSQ